MSSALRNLSADFAELLGPELPQGDDLHSNLPRDLQSDRRRDVSTEEHAGLLLGNLMAAALFGPRGELRERGR